MGIERPIEEELQKPIDLNFRMERVHYTILKVAKKNDGFYDFKEYKKKVIAEHPENEKLQYRLILWNQTTLKNMVDAGVLKKEKDGFRIVEGVDSLLEKEWIPGKNHIRLLKKNVNGILRSIDLKKEHEGKKEYEAKRQKKMIDGMLANLYKNGFLERIGKGEYRLTEKCKVYIGKNFIFANTKKGKKIEKEENVKITYFDRHIKEIMTDGIIDIKKLYKHKKSESLQKRIKTLVEAGLIIEHRPSEELLLKIDRVMQWMKEKELKIESLSIEQKQLVKDMRIFLNLSFSQITKYIYKGNKEMAYTDLNYLIKRRVLKKDPDSGIYVFDLEGIRLSNQMLEGEDVVRYKTKLESRKEEVEHDMLVYTAYQEFKREIIGRGGRILNVKNDRQMRHEDAQKYGHMLHGYPDLRVGYKEKDTLKTIVHDIEIDCGYDGKTILQKIEKMSKSNKMERGQRKGGSLSWYCNSVRQAAKVAKALTKNTHKRATPQQIYLFVLSRDGKVHKVRWQRELLGYR